jgi:hypothetical protein
LSPCHPNSAFKDETVAGNAANCAIQTPSTRKYLVVSTSGATLPRVQRSLFGRERSVITKHVNNVFKEGELEEKSNVQNMHIANSEKPVKHYSLDVIISVGYRV